MAGPIAVVIPAWNEEASLPAVLGDLAANVPEHAVVVVDDGSSDSTASVAVENGVTCLCLPFNLGIGGALRVGFRWAVRNGFDTVVQFDGDGQHDATQIGRLVAELDNGADMVIGSRFSEASGSYEVGRARRAAMALLRWSTRRLTGQSFTDTSSGFRAIRRPLLDEFARTYPVDYMDSVETLITSARSGYDVREVPVEMQQRTGGVPSTRNVRLVYHYARLLVVLASSRRRTRPTATIGDP